MDYRKDDDVLSVVVDGSISLGVGNELVAAVAGKKICVLGLHVTSVNIVTVSLYSGPGDSGTKIFGNTKMTGAEINVLPHFLLPISPSPKAPWCKTAAGESLVMYLNSGVIVAGVLVYILKD